MYQNNLLTSDNYLIEFFDCIPNLLQYIVHSTRFLGLFQKCSSNALLVQKVPLFTTSKSRGKIRGNKLHTKHSDIKCGIECPPT